MVQFLSLPLFLGHPQPDRLPSVVRRSSYSNDTLDFLSAFRKLKEII